MNRKIKFENIFCYFILLIMTAIVVIPVAWMFSTSIKDMDEIFALPPKWIPEKPSLDAYNRIWNQYPFGQYFLNSIIVVGGATIISLVFSSLSGYGLSRFNFKGKEWFLTFLIINQMFPSIMLLIPYFSVMKSLGLINTYAGLIFCYTSFTIPFCTWMMFGYFKSIPKDLDDAARLDGCSRLQILWLILLPLSLPGLFATGIYSVIVGWNEYMFSLILTTTDPMKTFAVGIGQLIGEYRIAWNDLMAASLIGSVPVIILFLYFQRYLISGLISGAVKS